MLVLSRRRNESVVLIVPPSDVPTVIKVATVDIRGDKVRIGFEAPAETTIHRREVRDRIGRGEPRPAVKGGRL